MRRPLATLRGRLLVSHLAVVGVGVVVLLVAGRSLGDVFIHDHLRSMSHMMSGMAAAEAGQLEVGIRAAFNRALVVAAVISAAAAVAASTFAALRLLRPLEEVRRVARRLAGGSYHERVPLPEEEELAALATDVNELAAALEETERRRLRLVSEVAHELRTPVTTLKGYLEGLLDGVFEPDVETLAAAIGEARRMERLADDLSALSRAEEGRIDLRLEALDLAMLAREVAERLRAQFDDQDVNLDIEPSPPLPVVVDRDRIAQVLTNLIGNALSYTPSGGRVRVTASRSAGTASIEVSDTGRGLTSDQLALVFDRFYRVDHSAVGGTGIGLTIARSLARLHGGDVIASSSGLGQGSSFVLTLPDDTS
jgi:signal transduction histidine kinase